jgi:hypothetical protein
MRRKMAPKLWRGGGALQNKFFSPIYVSLIVEILEYFSKATHHG